MQVGRKAVWSILYVSVAFFPSLKQNFIVYRSSKVSSRPDCIFKIHQLWQSGFSKVYSNSWCRCSFEAEIIEIGQSSHKMYRNNIVNFQESLTILNACTKKKKEDWKLIVYITYISLRSFPLPTFLSKKTNADRSVVTYADLAIWKYAVAYPKIVDKSLILSLLYLPVKGTDPGGDSCIWAAQFKKALLT